MHPNPQWKLASLLADKEKLFVLWNVRSELCRSLEDFQRHYGPDFPTAEMIDELKQEGFLSSSLSEFALTSAGLQALKYLDNSEPYSAPRDETQAVEELRKVLMDIGGTGITSELILTFRDRARDIYQTFPSSNAVADLYRKIMIGTQPAPAIEPESCRVLREQLEGTVTAREVVAALRASGFYRRTNISLRERDCYTHAIHGALQMLRASYEITEGTTLDRLEARIISLREVLDALPLEIEAPRHEVEKIIYALESKAARDRFVIWLAHLREKVEAQDYASTSDRSELKSNLWVRENATAPEVLEAQKSFARLEELRQAFDLQTTVAERVRDLIDLQQDYDEALNEVHVMDAQLREIGLRNREPLNSALDHLVDQLERVYRLEEHTADEHAPTETMLEASLSNLGRIGVQLQKVPDTHRERADDLYRKSTDLSEGIATRLNQLRLQAVRDELRRIQVEDVPAYIDQLRISSREGVSEWAEKVQLVWAALNHVRSGQEPSSLDLARLENAEEHLGPAPLTQAAKKAVADWKEDALRNYLWSSQELVEALEKIALDHLNAQDLGNAISKRVALIGQYKPYQSLELFPEIPPMLEADYKGLDQRVLRVRQSVLPEAIRRWASLTVQGSSRLEIEKAKQLFLGWHEVLGADLQRTEIQTVLDECSAEIEIQALLEVRKFDDAWRVIQDSRRLLSVEFIKKFTGIWARRKAAERYQQGHEAEIAKVIEEHGPDRELLRILVADFNAKGHVEHLARLHSGLGKIELTDSQTACLVQWAFEFDSGKLEELAHLLVTSKQTESVLMFAKGLAKGSNHVSALRVLRLALEEKEAWPAEVRSGVATATEILWTSFVETRSRIEIALNELIERCETEDEPAPLYDSLNDALLQEEIEAAVATAQAFLDASLGSVENWLTYLTAAVRFELDLDTSLSQRVQELDLKLQTNSQLLDRLSTARQSVESHGWMKLEELQKTLGELIVTVPPVTAVVRLLNHYLVNYQPTTEIVGELIEAWKKEGAGVSSAQLTNLVTRLKVDLTYDISAGQDRFHQLERLSGRTFEEFVEELRVMIAEIEAVTVYEELLLSAMKGKEEQLRRRLETGLRSDLQEVLQLLQQSSLGQSLLEWYRNPPETSHSRVAAERLRDVQASPLFKLLQRSVTLTEELKDTDQLKS